MSYWTPDREAHLWRLYEKHGPDYARIVDDFGEPVTRSQVRHRIQKGRPETGGADGPDPVSVESEWVDQPLSLEELLALYAVDTERYEVAAFTVNTWAGKFQTKAQLKPKPGATLELLTAQLVEDIRAETVTRARVIHRAKGIPDGELHMTNVETPDAHLGKLAHAEEVGENFDTRIAYECVQDAVSDLLWQAKPYPTELMVVPIGNDFFNVDNLVRTTTGGTPQDTDTRFHHMFRKGRALASWMIHECAKIAPVYVPIVPGNHDRQTSFCLGVVLEAEFANDPRVTIDNTARSRKYYRYGRNLLGWTHGDEEKPAELPQIMATEQPELWAQATHREFHIGHFHHGKEKAPIVVDDKLGVTVRWLRSLSGTDRWHLGKGYMAQRGAEAFVYRKSGGLRAHLFTYPEAKAA